MKILKHGNQSNATHVFKCATCGCEFEAKKDECYQDGFIDGGYICWYHRCPECDTLCEVILQ